MEPLFLKQKTTQKIDIEEECMADANEMEQAVEAIRKALSNLKFGSIEITVHDGKIVQIERKEKVRLSAGEKAKG